MAVVTKGKTFASGEVVTPNKVHELVDNATVTGIVNADIDAAAAIAASKLASVLDLSGKTVTLPAGNVTAAQMAATLDFSAKTFTLPDGNVSTAKLADASVTTAKLVDANVTTAKLADANVTEAKLAAASVATAKIADSAVTTAKIADSSSTTTGVTNAKLRQSAAVSVIGRSANSTGAPADIAASSDDHVLRRSSGTVGFGTITGGSIAAGISLSYPTLTGVREAIVNLGAVNGSQTFNLQSGNIFQVKPNGAITVSPSNVPSSGTFVGMLIRHEGDGTARTYTWPVTTKWAFGETPSMTSTNGKFDIVSLFTYDGGTTWFGQILGQNY